MFVYLFIYLYTIYLYTIVFTGMFSGGIFLCLFVM